MDHDVRARPVMRTLQQGARWPRSAARATSGGVPSGRRRRRGRSDGSAGARHPRRARSSDVGFVIPWHQRLSVRMLGGIVVASLVTVGAFAIAEYRLQRRLQEQVGEESDLLSSTSAARSTGRCSRIAAPTPTSSWRTSGALERHREGPHDGRERARHLLDRPRRDRPARRPERGGLLALPRRGGGALPPVAEGADAHLHGAEPPDPGDRRPPLQRGGLLLGRLPRPPGGPEGARGARRGDLARAGRPGGGPFRWRSLVVAAVIAGCSASASGSSRAPTS